MDYISFYSQHGVGDLKRTGKWYQGWCPFHADESSQQKGFAVNPNNGLWKCYSGCHGGAWHNAITFCKLKDIPIDQAPDYDPEFPKYPKYGYGKGAYAKRVKKAQAPKESEYHWWGIKEGEQRPQEPYNKEAIDLAKEENRTLWICEGPKDTQTMLEAGELATGIHAASYFNDFQNVSLDGISEVIIVCDNDPAGRKATEELKDMVPSAKVVVWPSHFPKGYDVTDFKEDVGEVTHEHFVRDLRTYVKSDTWQDEGELVDSFLVETKRGGPQYIKTGFKMFDERLDGLMPGGLHVIQGSSSIGKTTFCKQLADQVKEENPGLPIFFFALEDSLRTVRAMTLSRLSHDAEHPIENRSIRKGGKALGEGEPELLESLSPRVKEIYGRDYYLVAGEPNIDVRAIRERVERKLQRIGKETALVIVDYLQILPTPREQRLSSLMDRIDFNLHELQCLARDLNGPVILTSSTTKEDIKDTTKKREPGLVKGKGSANILYTPRMLFELIEADMEDESKRVELHVLKNSEGPKNFSVLFDYYPRYSKFTEESGGME